MKVLSRLTGARDAKAGMAAVIIVVLLIVSSVGVFLFATGTGSGNKIVTKGSVIEVNYYGQYWDGEKMVVFDTSLFSVAQDNGTYPKSMFFSYQSNASKYIPLEFEVGDGRMITGFDQGVVGMRVGETKVLVIPMEKAYRAMDNTKLRTISLNDTVPVQKMMTKAEFVSYYGVEPQRGWEYTDPNYGWKAMVSVYDGTTAVVINDVSPGSTLFKVYGSATDQSYGWYVNATLDGDVIHVRHLLNATSGLNVKGMDYSGLVVKGTTSSGAKLFVESVDLTNGTAVLNWNREVVGRTLTFTVTVVSIQ